MKWFSLDEEKFLLILLQLVLNKKFPWQWYYLEVFFTFRDGSAASMKKSRLIFQIQEHHKRFFIVSRKINSDDVPHIAVDTDQRRFTSCFSWFRIKTETDAWKRI